jgi:hypothetical protein
LAPILPDSDGLRFCTLPSLREMVPVTAIPIKDPRETEKKLQARRAHEERRALAMKRQRDVFAALAKFIHGRHGFLVSSPADPDLRIEVEQYSELPDELESLGYCLRPAGSGERIIGDRITPVLVYKFSIPLPR